MPTLSRLQYVEQWLQSMVTCILSTQAAQRSECNLGQMFELAKQECVCWHRNWLFLWNNIFFSMSYDSRGSFKDFGGDEAAFVAAVSNFVVYEVFGWFDDPFILLSSVGRRIMIVRD